MSTTASGKAQASTSNAKRIVFFHPDLGIGGAERLIVDAAVGLQDLGHKVTIFTSHCDPRHCFEEARNGTLDVRVRGNTIFPPTILNRFHILLAILRQIHLVLSIGLWGDELYSLKPDVFVVDQLAACIPLLRWLYPKRQRTLFYCHFPDQLLARRDEVGAIGAIKKLYRWPFDWFEGWSMDATDQIVVNSKFTRSVSNTVFPGLERELRVVYPCVTATAHDNNDGKLWDGRYKILLSINRFERKKDIRLAISAYSRMSAEERRNTRLILAGGYDQRVAENVDYHKELEHFAAQAGLTYATAKTIPTALAIPHDVQVLFLLSVPEAFKTTLLDNATLLLYTPRNEHFGIVPVEAMKHGLPVLASNTGGPLETIVDGKTGWLRDADKEEEWTYIIRKVLHSFSNERRDVMREAAKSRVRENFTKEIMAKRFSEEITEMLGAKRPPFVERESVVMAIGLVGCFAAGLLAAVMRMTFRTDPRSTEFIRVDRSKMKANAFVSPVMGAG
ncbi:Alpha-1,3-mannosyltransferase-like protein [Lithohypha guttulata]|uniref:Alpha-1,3/1,6-mannosyltransferase ALG2 n=1 Tax=Lithohypha guttulata TaxID=1690604 RepID=A0AAN7T074_9EURO|nr:Alpha-1,3-mannosyltransferase-like protein [Lithohypha guttulata]